MGKSLWKSLWIVCITYCIELLLWDYGNRIQEKYTGKTKLFYGILKIRFQL